MLQKVEVSLQGSSGISRGSLPPPQSSQIHKSKTNLCCFQTFPSRFNGFSFFIPNNLTNSASHYSTKLHKRHRFWAFFFKDTFKKNIHLLLIKSICIGVRLINSPSTPESSLCVGLNEVLNVVSTSYLQTTLQQVLCEQDSFSRKMKCPHWPQTWLGKGVPREGELIWRLNEFLALAFSVGDLAEIATAEEPLFLGSHLK